jgi:membrane protein implicated in regulation of membrane protease activity
VGDGTWTVSGPDLPAGTAVRVTAVDGNILVVEAV